jgi:EAL and modified HD-GYP domain-containing signal transduction protein
LYRERRRRSPQLSGQSGATIKVLANASLCPDADFQPAKIMVTFPAESVISDMPRAFLAERTVVGLPEYMAPSDQLVQALRSLYDDGYTIAVEKLSPLPLAPGLQDIIDIACIDLDMRDDESEALAASVRKGSTAPLLLAKNVEDTDRLEQAQRLGCTLFQGFFFQEPTTVSGRKVSSSEITRLKLFEIIEQEDPDFQALAATIESDVTLSYRLLTFLNSAAFSFSNTITSIRQAVVLVGWRQLKGWLRLVLLTDMAPPSKTQELCFLSAQRAKFLELSARSIGSADQADQLFMLGLFSLLEPMLDAPMADIVAYLPLEDDVQKALRRQGGPLTPWLALSEVIEQSRWDQADDSMNRLGLDAEKVAEAYQQSIEWANTFFGST